MLTVNEDAAIKTVDARFLTGRQTDVTIINNWNIGATTCICPTLLVHNYIIRKHKLLIVSLT